MEAYADRVAHFPDAYCFQHPCVSELGQNNIGLKVHGCFIIVWLDTSNKPGVASGSKYRKNYTIAYGSHGTVIVKVPEQHINAACTCTL